MFQHQGIGEVVGNCFYKVPLGGYTQAQVGYPEISCWPDKEDMHPFVFGHVEGVEDKVLTSTDKGVLLSPVNYAEVKAVVSFMFP